MDGMEDNKCGNYLPELNKELAVVHFVIVIQCVVKICYCYPLCGIRVSVVLFYVHYVVVKSDVTRNDGVRYVVVDHSVTRNDEEISIHAVEM